MTFHDPSSILAGLLPSASPVESLFSHVEASPCDPAGSKGSFEGSVEQIRSADTPAEDEDEINEGERRRGGGTKCLKLRRQPLASVRR
jgi:hypothetical protein